MADDLANVIANWRNHLKAVPQQGITAIDAATLHKFLDAAEAGMRARDAALEEAAAAVAAMKVTGNDKACVMAFILVRDACVERIRALRRPA